MSPGKLRSWFFTIPLEWLVTAVMITTAVVTSVVAPAGWWQRFLYRLWASMVLGLAGARVRVHHAERLDVNANYVVAANHLSLMDTPLMLQALPIEFKFLAKRELLRMPFIGWYLNRGGHLTVDRGSLRSSLASMNECARLIRERRLSVLIFPEGTRGLGELQPFKDGAAYLAIQAGVPIAPVAIHGTEDVLAAKSSHFRAADVDVIIGEPLPVAGLTLKDRGRLTAELQARVAELLAESRARRS
jgi:1-acyl-sn-glycerol-3-phosphate acyltransferase